MIQLLTQNPKIFVIAHKHQACMISCCKSKVQQSFLAILFYNQPLVICDL